MVMCIVALRENTSHDSVVDDTPIKNLSNGIKTSLWFQIVDEREPVVDYCCKNILETG